VQKEVSPPVTEMPGGPGNILSAAEALDLGGPISLRQPERQTGGLKPAELVHRVDPVYPGMARELRIEGTVKLHVTIGADGVVRNVEVLSGPQILVGAAASAVRQWRYSPTLLNGQPIQTENEISLVFRLP
jgi:protein TonB